MTLADTLILAGVTGIVNAVVSWRVTAAVIQARLDALAREMSGARDTGIRAHQRLDRHIEGHA